MNSYPKDEHALATYPKTELYSCCEGNRAPDWSEYEYLVLEGCTTIPLAPGPTSEKGSNENLGLQDRKAADFFTVYAWKDGCRAITDVGDFNKATRLIKHLSEISGLEYQINC